MKKIENDANGNERYAFTGKLLSVSSNELENVNGTKYRVISVEFKDVKGNIQRASGIVYAKNYEHGMTPGKEYLTTVTLTTQGPLITMSHLDSNADRPTLDMFVSEVAVAGVKANVVTGEIAS